MTDYHSISEISTLKEKCKRPEVIFYSKAQNRNENVNFFKGCCTNIKVYCSDSYVMLYSCYEIVEILLTLASSTNQSINQSINHITQDC